LREVFSRSHNYLKKTQPILYDSAQKCEYENKGDVISEIAIRFGVTINEIIQWNDLNNKSIYPGQKIKIVI